MHDEFGGDGTLSVGVIRTSCFMAKQPRPTGRSHKKDSDNWSYVSAELISGVNT